MNVSKIICFFVVSSLFSIQPLYAALAPSWKQQVIVVDHFDRDGGIVSFDGTIFEISSAEMKKKAQGYMNKTVHILFVDMGDRYVALEMKLASEPPFSLPAKASEKRHSPQ